jgi:O-methyltransferase involved in polyketide biosynthesis
MNEATGETDDTTVGGKLYLAFELGSKRWKLGFSHGLGQRPRERTIVAGDRLVLQEEMQQAKKLDAVARDFLAEHPGSVVLQLGCGLDSRFWRVDEGRVNWYDLDMPPVVEFRRQFFTGSERYQLIAASVTDLEWMDTVTSGGRPVLVVAEGLLMYLGEADVRRLVLRLHETFPGCRLIAEVFSRLTARLATGHPSLKYTGATIGWGIDDPCELEAWAPGFRLLEEWYFTDDSDLARLNFGYRVAYRLAGAFKMVRRAHRIVYYQL